MSIIRFFFKLINGIAVACNVAGYAAVGVFLTNRFLIGSPETRAKPYIITANVAAWPLTALAHAWNSTRLKGFARSLLWPFSAGRMWRLVFTLLGLRWIVQEIYRKLHPQVIPAEVALIESRSADLREEILAYEGLPTGGLRGLLNRVNELYNLEILTYEVRLSRLPAEFDGFTIVQLSDTHHVPILSEEFTRRCVELALDLAPDMIALTGDYQYYPPHVRGAANLLAPIGQWSQRERGGKGAFAVLGNHDIESGRDDVTAALFKAGIPVLDNANVRLEKDGADLYIAGVADPWSGRANLERTLRGIPSGACTILLAHVPDYLVESAGERIDLQLSGHNHGGQIQVPLLGALLVTSRYGRRYVEGFYKRGSTLMYVSRGLGGKPAIRWRARPDITRLILRAVR